MSNSETLDVKALPIQPMFQSREGVTVCIIWDALEFIVYCLIPSDPLFVHILFYSGVITKLINVLIKIYKNWIGFDFIL